MFCITQTFKRIALIQVLLVLFFMMDICYGASLEECINLGIDYYKKGEYDNAIFYYTKAIEIDPQYFEAYINRANIYASKKNYEQAISDYNKAIEINQNYTITYYNKAITCEEAGRIKEAIEAYRIFVQYASPSDIEYIEYVKKKIRELEKK